MSGRIARIVLAGRSADVWPVAALLSRELPQDIALHVVDSGAAEGVQAATVPLASDYHTRVGVDAPGLLTETDAALSLGSVLEDWDGEGGRLVTAPTGSLPKIGGMPLHQLVSKMVAEGDGATGVAHDFAQSFAPFRFAARAADAGKMALPSDAPDSPLAMLGPQASFSRADYAAMLRARCEERCVVTQGQVVAAQRHDGGALASITLSDGAAVSGDFFVDCSGDLCAAAGLDGDLTPLPTAPLNRITVATIDSAQKAPMPAYRALEDGLQGIIPTASRQHLVFACQSDTSDETIRKIMGEDAVTASVTPAATNAPWQVNLARLGTASARLGPMLSADMALLQAHALLLAECLPVRSEMKGEASAFNRKHAETLSGIADFAFAPFHLAMRGGELWQKLRTAEKSDNLKIRIDQFSSRGRIPVFERDHADEQSWIELLAGLGIVPARYDRRADAIPPAQAARILQTIGQQLESSLRGMESQAQFLERFR